MDKKYEKAKEKLKIYHQDQLLISYDRLNKKEKNY